MKHLLTLTLVAMLGFAVVGCNKTTKVNASATAAQCDASNCDPANCDKASCSSKKANCSKAGTAECPLAAATDSSASDANKRARRARYQEASDKMLKMVEAGEITQAQMDARLNRMKKAMAGKQAKPAAAGKPNCCASKK